MSFLPESNHSKLPCVLVLDGSMSMDDIINGDRKNPFRRIDAMNEGVKAFEHDIKNDLTAKKSVDISVVRVGNEIPEVIMDWTIAEKFHAPTIQVGGATPLAEALTKAISLCEERKSEYRIEGVDYFRPWIIVISDGKPTNRASKWEEVVNLADDVITNKKAVIIPIAVDNVGEEAMQKLAEVSSYGKVRELSSHDFAEFFVWLSASMTQVSNSYNPEEGQRIAEDLFA